MKLYELTYFISPNLSLEERQKLQENIAGLLQDKGAVMENSIPPVLRRLSYPIKIIKDFSSGKKEKKDHGYLASTAFRLEQNRLQEIQEKIRGLKEIIRFILVVKKERKKLPKKRTLFARPKTLKEKPEQKVELKQIEKKLEEILGQ